MPRLKYKLPSYSLHKASGQAVVKFDGHAHYLGKYGSPESHTAYRRLVAEWTTCKRLGVRQAVRETSASRLLDELLDLCRELATRVQGRGISCSPMS
jgi:hypothetical protein